MDEERIEESLVLEGDCGDVSAGETSWLHGKAQMLDEVNQLVELMTAEKSKLQEKILALETEVDDYHKQTEELRQSSERRKERVSKLKLEQSLLKEKNSQQQTLLHTTLHRTRKELRDVQQQVDSITQSLAAERQCHLAVKSKLEKSEKNNRDLLKQLHQQQTENKKLQERLTKAQAEAEEAQSHRHTLESQLKIVREKERKSRDEILALRGRLGRSQRAQTQLQTHCSLLEKEIEAQASRLATIRSRRSKEETKLVHDCRKKDELLATYLQKISVSQGQQQVLQKEIRGLKAKLSSDEMQIRELKLKVEESEQNNCELQRQVDESTHKRKQEAIFEEELSQLRPEIRRLRAREETYREQLMRKQEEVDRLHRQLETSWRDHQSSAQLTEARWRTRLQDARSDYQRLKEASTRRCAELAKEVWQLKSMLESQ